jgi:hypothetical protein
MKRMVVAALVLAACGNKSGSGGGGSAGSGTAGSAGPAIVDLAQLDGNVLTRKVVNQAFGGSVPAFPLLSKAGIAAVAVETQLRTGEGSIYSVMFLPPGAGGPWDQVETFVIVDAMLAKLLTEGSPDGTSEPIYDRDGIASRALAAKARLEGEGYSPFEGAVDPLVRDQPALVGPVFIEQKSTESGLQLQLADPSGIIHGTDNIPNQQTAMVTTEDCTAKPIAKRAWFHTARKRVLVEIGWDTPTECVPPEIQYRLFALKK